MNRPIDERHLMGAAAGFASAAVLFFIVAFIVRAFPIKRVSLSRPPTATTTDEIDLSASTTKEWDSRTRTEPIEKRDGWPSYCGQIASVFTDGQVHPASCLPWAKADAGLVKKYGGRLHAVSDSGDMNDGCLQIVQPSSHRRFDVCGDSIKEWRDEL